MSIRKLVTRRGFDPAVVHGEQVRVRRLSVAEMMEIGELPINRRPAAMVAAAVYENDGTDSPLFASAAEADACEWMVFQPLLEAVNRVNTIDVEEAEKK